MSWLADQVARDTDRAPLDRALRRYEEQSPDLALRAADALDRLLGQVASSPWPEVAWCFSTLTADRYPVELVFTTLGQAIRYVVEVAGPETDPGERLDVALAVLQEIGVGKSVGAGRAPTIRYDSLREMQRPMAGRLRFGAWVGGRHSPDGDAYKLYVEVPKDDSSAAEAWSRSILGNRPPLTDRAASLRMIGLELPSDRVELYFRADGLQPWEVDRLMGLLAMHHQAEELLGLVEEIAERSTAERLPAQQTGFSISAKEDGTDSRFSLFWLARHLLGSDARVRRRLLDVAVRRQWPLDHYAAISEPLARHDGPPTRHGILAFVAAPGLPPLLQIGLRPP